VRTRRLAWSAALAVTGAIAAATLRPSAARGGDAPPTLAAPPAPPAPPAAAPTFARDARPFVEAYCAECHGERPLEGAPTFVPLLDEAAVAAQGDLWRRAAARVRAGEMPPAGSLAPTGDARVRFLRWVEAVAPTSAAPAAGRSPLRRLNRMEYHRTIADLLGIDETASSRFPSDEVGAGFDRTGDALSLSPLLIERYAEAAERIADQSIVVEEPGKPAVRHYEAEALASSLPSSAQGKGRNLFSNGEVRGEARLPRDGTYLFRVRCASTPAGDDPAQMLLTVDGKGVASVDVTADPTTGEIVERPFRARGGTRPFTVAFTNDFYDPKHPDPARRDRNLLVDWVEIVGPTDPPPAPPESHRRVFATDPGGDDVARRARRVLGPLATRAFRRPVRPAELDRLVELVREAEADGAPFAEGVRDALEAVLVSPHFLFHIEEAGGPPDAGGVTPLDDFALAARLSYFLWSTLPDAALTAAAARGELGRRPSAPVRRMLADPRAGALVDGFADQWLTLRRLATATPDPERFPAADAALRADLLHETEMFFEAIVQEDRSVLDLLDAPFTFVNERLARHYGIPGVAGDRFRRVALDGEQRAGILSHGSVLLVTSYPTRTSPVKRGKWLLEQLLGQTVPPPPPGAGDLPATGAEGRPATLRERMAQHLRDPACAACHQRLDPLGLAFENYDAVGSWRSKDGDADVDPSGVLPDGRRFATPKQLRALLRADPAFPRGFASHLLTYALGRALTPADAPHVDAVVARAAVAQHRVSAYVEAVVESVPFRSLRTTAPPPESPR